jgi:hypothetical protein
MSNRAASTAESPAADLPATPVNPASESVSEKLSRPRDDRAASDRAASEGTPSGGEGTPSGEIGGPAGSEPTRYGDWEKKGRCIDF